MGQTGKPVEHAGLLKTHRLHGTRSGQGNELPGSAAAQFAMAVIEHDKSLLRRLPGSTRRALDNRFIIGRG
jgi:hypothetical protein